MTEEILLFPEFYSSINTATKESGFTMASDPLTGSLLRTLAVSKPGGKFLELGTGTGLSTAWILDGMNEASSLISVDNDEQFLDIAKNALKDEKRLQLVLSDAGQWLEDNQRLLFDYIFADTWHGKYLMLDTALKMLNAGGLYIIDDMLPQPNWPEGHQQKAIDLIMALENRNDIVLTRLAWSTGIIIAVKK